MATNAFEAIRKAYPDSVKYETNYNRLQKELQALDARTAEKIARSGIEYFIVYHPALTYYARDYGLRQVAIETDGKEPSAKQLTAIIRQAREEMCIRDRLSNRESLRDLIVAMEAHAGKLYHLGIGKSVTRSNLNKANEQRNYRIFEEFATDSSDAKEQKNNITFTERFRDLP